MRPNNLKDVTFQGLRGRIAAFVEHRFFTRFITVIVLLNALTLGLETSPEILARHGSLLLTLDQLVLGIFVVELSLKFYLYRLSFFRAGWNVFDFLVVSIALVPAVGALSVLRTLRILRVLRLVSVVPQMRRVISALLHAIPGMASIIAVLLIIFYVASVLVTKLFGGEFEALFGSIGASMYTLFQVMTLEGWSEEVVRPVMAVYPVAWVFFIPFIIITSFAVLNLFIGIIVDAINVMHQSEGKPYMGPERRRTPDPTDEIRALRKEISELRSLLESKGR